MRKSLIILAAMFTLVMARLTKGNFTWPPNTHDYDCMVFVRGNYRAIGTGVIVGPKCVIIAANALETTHATWRGTNAYGSGSLPSVRIITIDGHYTSYKAQIPSLAIVRQAGRVSEVYVQHGFDKQNSPVHDFTTISFKDLVVPIHTSSLKGRKPFYVETPISPDYNKPVDMFSHEDPEAKISMAFFNPDTDNVDVYDMTGENVFENCDGWLPREWGYFICILNIYKLDGLQSGAGLFVGHLLIGLGSFMLEKGDESILVFTDLRAYNSSRWKSLILLAAVFSCVMAYLTKGNYTWPQYTHDYDCMVFMASATWTFGTGVIVGHKCVIIAANTLDTTHASWRSTKAYAQLSYPSSHTARIFTIDGFYTSYKAHRINHITISQAGRRSEANVQQGFDELNSPVHDFAVLSFKDLVVPIHTSSLKGRKPFYVETPISPDYNKPVDMFSHEDPEAKISMAFFNPDTDNVDVYDMTGENVFENCDGWLPREWGYFICILNIYKLDGLQSGAGLFVGHLLIGLGSFMLEKGDESILVFTDLRAYNSSRYVCYT